MYSMLEDTICICVSLYLHKETLKRNKRNTQGCRAGEGKDISLILSYMLPFLFKTFVKIHRVFFLYIHKVMQPKPQSILESFHHPQNTLFS